MLIDESRNGETIEVAVGSTIDIHLPENASTGFRWSMTSRGEPSLAVISDERRPPSSPAPGATGEHRWQLRATAAGECDVAIAYRRPWEDDSSQGRRFIVHVRVTARS